jgi:hypothetical protein
MRIVLMLALLGACVDNGAPKPDAGTDPTSNLDVAIGKQCDPDLGLICGAGSLGACVDGTCEMQCSPVSYPRCSDGLSARLVPIDENSHVCVCD